MRVSFLFFFSLLFHVVSVQPARLHELNHARAPRGTIEMPGFYLFGCLSAHSAGKRYIIVLQCISFSSCESQELGKNRGFGVLTPSPHAAEHACFNLVAVPKGYVVQHATRSTGRQDMKASMHYLTYGEDMGQGLFLDRGRMWRDERLAAAAALGMHKIVVVKSSDREAGAGAGVRRSTGPGGVGLSSHAS